jgi:hypothetical protein
MSSCHGVFPSENGLNNYLSRSDPCLLRGGGHSRVLFPQCREELDVQEKEKSNHSFLVPMRPEASCELCEIAMVRRMHRK